MSTKAIKKQLAAAVAMVLVAALALGSSTFAWFANNNKVTASELSINAAAEGALLVIHETEADLFNDNKTTATLTADNATLFPTHFAIGAITNYAGAATSAVWSHAFSDSYSLAVHNSTEKTLEVSEIDSASGDAKIGQGYHAADGSIAAWGTSIAPKNIYLMDQIFVGAVQPEGETVTFDNLYVTGVTIKNEEGQVASNLMDAVRVLIKCDGKYFEFINGKVVTADAAVDGTGFTPVALPAISGDAIATGNGVKINNTTKVSGTAMEIDVYVYFDGRDTACKSENFDLKKVKISLELTAGNNL